MLSSSRLCRCDFSNAQSTPTGAVFGSKKPRHLALRRRCRPDVGFSLSLCYFFRTLPRAVLAKKKTRHLTARSCTNYGCVVGTRARSCRGSRGCRECIRQPIPVVRSSDELFPTAKERGMETLLERVFTFFYVGFGQYRYDFPSSKRKNAFPGCFSSPHAMPCVYLDVHFACQRFSNTSDVCDLLE